MVYKLGGGATHACASGGRFKRDLLAALPLSELREGLGNPLHHLSRDTASVIPMYGNLCLALAERQHTSLL